MDEERELEELLSNKYKREYACSKKVAAYIEKATETRISGVEVMYLAIHIRRVTMVQE